METNLMIPSSQNELQEMVRKVDLIHDAMKQAMIKDTDYGIIAGCSKPTLLKPGAEKLCQLFRLRAEFENKITYHNDEHLSVVVTCRLVNINTGETWGTGNGISTTYEGKHRYRRRERECPLCGSAAIIRGKTEYGGGWLCFEKKGGCGKKFEINDSAITGQSGFTENLNPADQWNTVLKMAEKRAYVGATLYATAASGLFTQDMEAVPQPKKPPQQPVPKPTLPSAIDDTIISLEARVKNLSELNNINIREIFPGLYADYQKVRLAKAKPELVMALNSIINALESTSGREHVEKALQNAFSTGGELQINIEDCFPDEFAAINDSMGKNDFKSALAIVVTILDQLKKEKKGEIFSDSPINEEDDELFPFESDS